ncbi:MAG: V-type ATP synthase subunit A [Chlamydiae bacterium]|nr:V-type ATP synthase subunit A [Chlamydiota bacterium]
MIVENTTAKGKVQNAYGNLLSVKFEGSISLGEVGFVHVGNHKLKAEVIEIESDIAKIQVFEDTTGIRLGTEVTFDRTLLEVSLAPGLLGSIYDGLQNPLEEIANTAGAYLPRGLYVDPIDDVKHWAFTPNAQVGSTVKKGDLLGIVPEGRFSHKIFVPFQWQGEYKVTWIAEAGSYTVKDTIAKLEDKNGKELKVTMLQKWPVKRQLMIGERIKPHKMLFTGLRILDTQNPLLQGETLCTPGPFGAGKTVTQHHLAKYSSVDIVIVVACGERAGEVVETLKTFPFLKDVYTDEPLINRTIIICNTSSMPVAAREASVYTGMAIAEYYRQMGLNVLLLADSTSRWMQAMREMSGRLEEIPAEEAFPAYLSSRVANFYERAGVIITPDQAEGSITVVGAVSPAGGNFNEPGTQATLKVVAAFACLSKEYADARKYPAIDPLASWSKCRDDVAKIMSKHFEHWGRFLELTDKLLVQGLEVSKRMEVVGLEGTLISDYVVYLKSELYSFVYLQQNAFDKEDAFCPLERQVSMVKILYPLLQKDFTFKNHDEAKAFFVDIQRELKNINYLPFQSESYKKAEEKIEGMLYAKGL